MQEHHPVPGTAFHRLLAGRRRPWLPLLISVAAIVASLLIVTLAAAILVIVVVRLTGDPDFSFDVDNGINAGEMFATNLGLALQIPVAAGLIWGLYRVRPAWLVSNQPGFRWTWLGLCVAMSAVVWSLFLVLGTLGAWVSRDSPLDAAVVWFLLVVLLTTPLQAAGEEFLFRGLLLQALGSVRLPTWACCLLNGALFATAHLQFDPPLFADRLLLGTAFAWLAIQTGGIEAGIAIHAVKNIAVLIPAGLLDDVSEALDPSGVSWLPVVVDAVFISIALAWIVPQARRRGLGVSRDALAVPRDP